MANEEIILLSNGSDIQYLLNILLVNTLTSILRHNLLISIGK